MMKLYAILAAIILAPLSALAQHTTVTAQVKDPVNQIYRTCTGGANFVGQNSTPGAGPYLLNGGSFQTTVPINCDGGGNFTISLADNNQISPTPSQWNFSICSAIGVYPGPVICFNALVTITGVSQNITAQLQAASAPLPPYSAILETNGVRNGSQSLLNLINGSNVTIVDNGAGGVTISSSGGGGGGGGGGLPDPGANGLVYRSALNTTSAVPNAATGSLYVSTGLLTLPITQQKVAYDIRDWGFTCDGTTYNTSAASTLISAIGSTPALVQGTAASPCGMGDLVWPSNITLDFSTGWQLKTLTDSTTTPGSATFNTGGSNIGHCQSDNTTTTCNMSVTATANDTYLLACGRGFSGGSLTFTSNVGSDVLLPLATTSTGLSSVTQAALVPSVAAGAHTFTATSPNGNLIGSCTAVPISGLGPTPYAVDTVAICNNSSANSPYSCTGSFTAGDFLLFVASQNNTGETCTGAGGGFTLVPSTAGCSTTTLSNLAIAYQNAAAGGSVTPTISFTPSPAGHNPSSLIIGLRPASGINQILGGVNNPSNRQAFVNATAGQGLIDFTGNTVGFDVWPEWWGALGNNSLNSGQMTVNTAAINAAVVASFGNANRINGSGLEIYNKRLRFCGTYNINGAITFNHVNNFVVEGCGRLNTILNQTASNTMVLNGNADAYGRFANITFASTASQTTSFPLTQFDYNAALGTDFAPQFIDFFTVGWNGNGVTAIGMLGAPSGGGAQFSNIYCYDCNALSFTQAAWQIGTPTSLAQNALAIAWFGGDIQGSKQYGFAGYGAGFTDLFGVSMENGYGVTNNVGVQTGADVLWQDSQGPIRLHNVRSESRRLCWCSQVEIYSSRTIFQDATPVPGATQPVGTLLTGSKVAGDGADYIVTVNSSGFSGYATPSAPAFASGGSSSTLVDQNVTVTGSVTQGLLGGASVGETMTQATTGATAARINSPANNATIAGTLTSGTFGFGDTATQATTSVTCTVGSGNTSTVLNCSNFSGAPDNSHTWTDGTTGATFNPSATPVFAAASPVLTMGPVTGSPDSSHTWTGGTSGGIYTPTQAPQGTNWTVNTFAGQFASVMTGTSALCYATIASNTSNTLTISGSWITRYPYTYCPGPDSTSTFIIEPGWSHSGTVTSGGMQFQYNNSLAIAGAPDALALAGRIEDTYVAGGQVILNTAPGGAVVVSNLTVTRQDWWGGTGGNQFPQSFLSNDKDWDVHVLGFGGNIYETWTLPAITGVQVTSSNSRKLGDKQMCWETGTIGSPSNISANEVCIGGRGDPTASTDTFRSRVEILGGLGPVVPVGLNQNGTDLSLLGGGSTGSGTGGNINFRISNVGSSSATPNGGTTVWRIDGVTGHLFAQTDNTNDIGATAANRPRRVYAGTDFVGPIGATTPAVGTFTTLNVSGTATLGSGSTKSVATGTASNTDLTGELTFSGATTSASYAFTGTYVSHPECTIGPQFTPGAGHVIWISTLNTTTLQLSSDTAQTGAVSYICVGRN